MRELELKIADIDADGALREAAARLPTRGQFLARCARAVATAAVAAGVLPATSRAAEPPHGPAARPATRDDRAILNFALALEYLQSSFYTEAERVGALRGALAEQARIVGSHERAHVRAFQAVLGSAAIKRPRFDFHGVTDDAASFRSTAVALEDLAVAAYKEQLPLIRSDRYLATAVAIHSVEARHAAWIRRLAGILPAPAAFDDPTTDRRTVEIVNATRFVTLRAPHTTARRAPSFTG